ncbi:MAG TPA: SAM-dependent methyltransferase [Candidatus Saccharimonadales bacterium]|nr:SAM-dependent methyltransferase [Candidatus Saccharimonadales bacterium]
MSTHDPRLELRHAPGPDLSDVGTEMELEARIREEIARTGPMPFARFMDLALYDPTGGYYRAATARPGRDGDFVTAPELHPIFGASLAVAADQIRQRLGDPRPFTIREYGAGSGALARALLDELRRLAPHAELRYEPVEVDERRVGELTATLAEAGLADRLAPPSVAPIDGLLLANEVLDALPVHRVRQRGRELMELAVDLGPHDAFVEREVEPSTPALAARLVAEGIELVDGQTAEICLALDAWVATAAAGLRRGVLLCIDYGAPATELYDPIRRRDGTLRAYVRQQVHADPYRHVGRQDLTAHVDVTAVERAAHAAGLRTIGVTTQAEALMGLGIEARLQAVQADPATSFEAYTLLRASLKRLLDPAAMGRFGVMAFGRDWPVDGPDGDTTLGLFAYRLPARTRPARTPPD